MRRIARFVALLTLLAVPLRSAHADTCLRPSPAAAARDGTPLDLILTQGRADFAAGRFDDAATRLRDVAMKHPDVATALDAAKLYIESLNVLGSKQSRVACFDDLAADVPKLLERYCVHEPAMREDATCVLLDKIQFDIQRLRAQGLVEEADKNGGDTAPALFEKGGVAYFDIFREHCQAAVAASRPLHPTAAACAEVGYNAARAFTAAHVAPKAITAYGALISFDERAKASSPLAAKAHVELGAHYQALAIYDVAAEWYERYATLHPRSLGADKALLDAAVLRLGLGQEALATNDAALFAKNWGITRRAQVAQLALAIASYHADKGAWDKAHGVLTSSLDLLDRGPPDLTTKAHVLLARGHVQAHAPELAAREYAKVLAAWSDPQAAEQAIRRGWPGEDESQADRRLARALNAVGEALFAAAEQKRLAEVEPLKLPVYVGAADRASVLDHVQTKVRPWFQKKRAAIALSEAEYIKILDLKPVPPPMWVVDAASATGMMWGELADDFRRVPIPDAWRNDRLLYHAYYDALDDMSESIRARYAKPALKKCVDLAAKYQYGDARSHACEVWLAAHYKTEFHLVDELIPAFRAAQPQRTETPPFSYEGRPRRWGQP